MKQVIQFFFVRSESDFKENKKPLTAIKTTSKDNKF